MNEQWDRMATGKYFVVTGLKFHAKCRHEFNGRPFKIIHKDFPFIISGFGSKRMVFDFREVVCKLVTKKYVKAFVGVTRGKKTVEIKPAPPGPEICKRCGDRMVQRMKQGSFKFYFYCEHCDIQGEAVPA